MNMVKPLLGFGSVLFAISLAHAANAADAAIAAEPEHLEYVRLCDAYGAGYFFIPGTETCLKISGTVRTEGKWHNPYNPGTGGDYGTLWHSRAQIAVDTASDTEYGALKTDSIYRFDWQEGVTTDKLVWANISLAGFTIGKIDSAYNLYMGYAGNVMNDDIVYDGPPEINQITYNYDAGNGITAVVSLEDTNSGADLSAYNGAWVQSKTNEYIPNAVAGIGYKSGAWQIRFVGGYDAIVEEGAVKARVDADFGIFKAFLMGGWNTDGNKLNKYAGSNLDPSACPAGHAELCGWGDWALWTGVTLPIDEKLQANGQVALTDSKILQVTTNIRWSPVKNMLVEPEVTYTKFDSVNQEQWAGILRLQRSF
ncbi:MULTISPECIES: porin [unclassified Rhizobium]|uniref:porin n=2 Tax=Rhizobium TaxID=379 RepID=UPI001AD9BA10|nr:MULTISPECIES: porin [unclassified Rhizobium]MBO9099598.1 porin [Rhizobium sp. L58/93]QXZ86929.1 porin [Rhizobium sp. K1/93]QXZ93037.1 porin [Rhizobium sp. K15/93]